MSSSVVANCGRNFVLGKQVIFYSREAIQGILAIYLSKAWIHSIGIGSLYLLFVGKINFRD